MELLPNRIFLIGYMGSGKTSVSKYLSVMTGSQFIDMDQEIERTENMPIRTIFIKYGEHEFRNKESELLDRLCHVSSALDIMAGENIGSSNISAKEGKYRAFADIKEPLIVSCGGGIILDGLNRIILKDQCTVFLEADPEMLFQRVNGDANRPYAYMDIPNEEERKMKFLDLYKKREPLYREAASVIIKTDKKSPETIAKEILIQVKK
ncbi:MAG: shikimate kinase [Desulfitobacteriaceae bacterium]|nr:shikimate kinase [Desulfitobacteriaceae bacterium]